MTSGSHAENIPITNSTLAFQVLLDKLTTQNNQQFHERAALSENDTGAAINHQGNPHISASNTSQNLIVNTSPAIGFSNRANSEISDRTEALSLEQLQVHNETTLENQQINPLPNQNLDFTGASQLGSSPQAPAQNGVSSNSSNPQREPTTANNQTAISSSTTTGPTYSDLGIVTDRPKRPEYALKSERLKTFSRWPNGHHLQPTELADAGFYFAGYGDCARCFYCGGGLRNWEDEDDVWVEHARWFSKCSYIRQRLGQVFVDAVQDLNKTLDKIPFNVVVNRIGVDAFTVCQIDVKEDTLQKDPAVKAVVGLGVPLNVALDVARILKSEDSTLSADKLLAKIKEERRDVNIPSDTTQVSLNDTDLETVRKLKESNNVLRQQTACKICMDKEVEIVFLPCGHLVSCTECASAMRNCPVCRKNVRGTVRAFIS